MLALLTSIQEVINLLKDYWIIISVYDCVICPKITARRLNNGNDV